MKASFPQLRNPANIAHLNFKPSKMLQLIKPNPTFELKSAIPDFRKIG